MSSEPLDAKVLALLRSQTFDADELPAVLVKQGFDAKEVDAAIASALATIDREENSPSKKQARENAKKGKHLLRLGVMWLLVGGVASLIWRQGVLGYLLVVGVGAALIFAGNRSIKASELRRTDY